MASRIFEAADLFLGALLLANVVERGTLGYHERFLFFADSLTGEWTPHPTNSVVSDVRRSIPAGKLFEQEGKLMRPAQDCLLG